MPSWNQVLDEIQQSSRKDSLDFVRRKYIKKLSTFRGRNLIVYYSGWLQHPNLARAGITDDDKNGLMAAVHKLDRTKGLDILLHTPGGDMAATESIIDYLHKMFNGDIVGFVPQLAMSGGTMIACSCKEIFMGKQSNIGPIDPQFGGIPAHGVLKEFAEAIAAIKKDPASIPIWQVVVSKYHPTLLGECRNAIDLATEVVAKRLVEVMFAGDPDAKAKASKIVKALNEHDDTKTHARHIHIEEAKAMGLKIRDLEDDQTLQDLVLTIHHSLMHGFGQTQSIKLIENQLGNTVISFTN